ncbi:MAG TPA: ABC transporter substrate-binding protein [Baekduia sp.]|uniref:ABC transporter substrate-binding protein n=1 Tax=Baekduia sp. TaxID=2600305 RepID=UPI002D78758D|nr:ABC transporter substrate-binding protein [Baekduia sp.]HET6507605.1 ABC transporter substrate-binding protein [Baekduia sp.]
MRDRAILAALALAGAAGLAACGGSGGGSGATGLSADAGGKPATAPSNAPGAPGRPITVAVPEDPGSLDPAAGSGDGESLHQLIYDPLVHLDANGKVVSGLATAWKGGARKLTFTLRKDATCADGTPVTASLVRDNFKRMEDPSLPVPNLRLNTNKFDVHADDAKGIVSIALDRPNSFFLEALAHIYIVCPAGLKNDKLLTSKGAGSGPFVLTSATPGDRYVLTRRKDYKWGADGAGTAAAGFPESVTVRVVTNETTAANLLIGGQLDVAAFQGAEVSRVQGAGKGKLDMRALKIRSESLLYNQAPGRPMASEAVREALTSVIDRAAFARVLTSGFGGPATGVAGTEPIACGYDVTGALPKGDVAQAKQRLADDGWRAGGGGTLRKDGRPLTLQALFPPDEASAFEYLQGAWKALGVDLRLNPKPTAAIDQTLISGGSWDVTALYPPSSFPSAVDTLVQGAAPPNGTNIGKIDNPVYDRLSASAKKLGGAAGCEAWSKAETELYKSADLVPVAQRQALWAWKPELTFVPQGNLKVYIPTSLRSPER